MKHIWTIVALSSVACWLFIPAACSCDEEQSEEDIAKALANKLTDSLGFEGGTVVEGTPPEDHADNPDYAQVTGVQAPAALAAGQAYAVSLNTNFADPRAVTGAVVYVDKADKFLKIDTALDPEALVLRLAGTFKGDPELVGKSFKVRLALHDADVAVGNYVVWELAIKEAAEVAPTTQELQAAIEVNGAGSPIAGNIPLGSSDISAPQVISIEAPDRVGPDRTFDVTVTYHAGAAAVEAVLFQIDNSTSYVEVPARGEAGMDGNAVLTVKFDPSKLSEKAGRLGRALRALSYKTSALATSTITLRAALRDEGGRSGTPKTKSLIYTTNSGECSGKGCGGTAAKNCLCGDSGVTLTPISGCDQWPDAAQCSGFASAYCGEDIEGTCHESFDTTVFQDREQATNFGCTIQINCGSGGTADAGVADAGGEDAGMTNSCTGRNVADPCVPEGGTEPTGVCYLETFTPPDTYTLTCYEPCDVAVLYESCGTGKRCCAGWVPQSDGGHYFVFVCAPEGTAKSGSTCAMFYECENGTQCFGMGADAMTCTPTCKTDGSVECPDPVSQKCNEIGPWGGWGVCE
ncbi:MAG: hypothetical protein HY897_04640 [Deltaproteobacteria bacterium]|nr:hypothetical protein [Deltaproteobacteria bacterium]